MSQIPGQNKFAEAVVEISADTTPLQQGVQQAKTEVESLGETGKQTGLDMALNWAPAAAAMLAVASAALEAGKQIGDLIEKSANKGTPDDFLYTQSEKLADLKKKAEEYRKEAEKTSISGTIDDLLSNGRSDGKLYSDRQRAVKNYNDTLNQIQELENRQQSQLENKQQDKDEKEAKRKADRLARDLAREQESSLQGVDKIIAERDRKISDAQKQYGADADPLVRQIAANAESEINRFKTNQAIKKGLEDQAREEREKKEKESAEKIAKHMAEAAAKAMSSALSGISAEFQNVFNAQLGQMSFTIEGLAANVEKIANQRRASG